MSNVEAGQTTYVNRCRVGREEKKGARESYKRREGMGRGLKGPQLGRKGCTWIFVQPPPSRVPSYMYTTADGVGLPTKPGSV